MTRPTLSRDVTAEIRASLESLSREALEELACNLMRTYVVQGTMPFNLPIATDEYARETPDEAQDEERFDFPRLIGQLKSRLSDIPELRYFSVENGRVVLTFENQKIIFGDRISTQFVPISAPTPPARPPQAAPSAPLASAPAAAPAREKAAAPPAKKQEEKPLNASEQEALDSVMQRFKRLELD